ncbi:pentapeptide repeat-containing protein [Methylobacterium sp. Leaf113]|uniref:pentapeptide repeat-containing protein n=1 Tax=Methylobacterium sp. Leaf113 TaxID=1736259 RepID=UPI003FCE8EA1
MPSPTLSRAASVFGASPLGASIFDGSDFGGSDFSGSNFGGSDLTGPPADMSGLADASPFGGTGWPGVDGLAGSGGRLPVGDPGRLASLLGGFTVQGSLPVSRRPATPRSAHPAPGGSWLAAQLVALVLASGPPPERGPYRNPVGPEAGRPARSASSSGRSATK